MRLDIFKVIRTNLSVEDNFTLSDLDWMPIEDMHYDGESPSSEGKNRSKYMIHIGSPKDLCVPYFACHFRENIQTYNKAVGQLISIFLKFLFTRINQE